MLCFYILQSGIDSVGLTSVGFLEGGRNDFFRAWTRLRFEFWGLEEGRMGEMRTGFRGGGG